MANTPTRYARTIRWIQDHKLLCALLVLGTIVIALGAFAEGITRIVDLFDGSSPSDSDGGRPIVIQPADPEEPAKESALCLNAVRFLDDDPDKIDVLIKNVGSAVAVVDKAVFHIQAIHTLTPNVSETGALVSTETYVVEFDAKKTPYEVEVALSQQIPANHADRFQILIVAEDNYRGDEYVYEFSIEFHYDGKVVSTDRVLYLERFPSRYLPPPQLHKGTQMLLKKWSSYKGVKSPRLQWLIEELADL